MNFNVWNIKEMFSIPSGSGVTKPSNWKSNQTDCSLSDSQFLFGSQFCPENSETLLASLDADTNSRHPKQTQQSSVDNEPSIFTKYQTKPQLFGGDTKDEGLFSIPLPAGKSKGLLKQFEEKNEGQRTNVTETLGATVKIWECLQHIKCHIQLVSDSELLYNFVSHFQEVINKLQTSVEKSEKHLSSRSQSILDSLESIAETFQESARVQHDLMVEAVQEKSSMEQTILEIRKRSEARQADFIEMKSNLKNLEVLVAQQSNNFQQLCENLGQLNVPGILEELKKFASVSQVAQHLKDSTSQTSPSLAQSPRFTMQEKYPSEEPATWQAQVSLAGNPSKSFQRPGKFAGAESDGFQKAALPADGPHRGNEHVKNKIYCKNWVMTTRSLSNCCSNLPSQEVASDRDQIVQEASQLGLNKCEARVKNICPKYETQSMFSFDSFEQSAAEQKGGTCRKGRKSKKQPSRKSKRGRYLARKQEQTPRKECAFVSKHHSSQSPISSPQGPLLRRLAPRGSTKSACQNLEGTAKTSKAAQGNRLQSTQSFSSFQGEQQINWFTDLSLEIPEPPLFKKGGKNLLCDPDFDSSDDNL